MKRQVVLFSGAVFLFVNLAFIVKTKYYYVPYPNLIEYFLSAVLVIIIFFLLLKRNTRIQKLTLLTGIGAITLFMCCVTFLNYIFEWHPITLNPPFYGSQSFEVDYEPFPWTTASPESAGYDGDAFDQYTSGLNRWENLRALLVVKDDNLIIEKYYKDATKYSAYNVHSVTKSVTAALVGIAIRNRYINSENDLVMTSFPEYTQTGQYKEMLQIKHLLSMRGGWAGGDGFQTVEECLLQERLAVPPGQQFKYYTGSQNVLSAIITKNVNRSSKDFANEFLFEPIGVRNAFWRKVDGYYVGGDESYFTARDLARFGLLYLNYGSLEGRQIIDSVWIKKSLTSYTSNDKSFRSLAAYDEIGYGYCWWILKTKSGKDAYSARGKGGQHIILIPDRDVVVVILQDWVPWKKDRANEDRLLGELLEFL